MNELELLDWFLGTFWGCLLGALFILMLEGRK